MLHLCFWEKNDICLILIPGAVSGKKNRGLAWQKKSCCSQPSWSFSQPISSRCCSLVCRLLLHWRPTKQKGCTGGLNSAVVVGTGLAEQAHRDTHHAAGTLGSLFEPLLCGACFFFFLFLQSHQFGWSSTRATLKEPTGGCGLAKADRLLASYCWFSTLVHCHCCRSPLRCGLQYGEWRLEASHEWRWTFNTGVAVYFPSFCPHCEGLHSSYSRTFFFLCAGGKKRLCQGHFYFFFNPERRPLQRRMKLRKQVTVCGGAIFCVAVFSLYLMLDRVQHDPARRQNGGNFPRVRIITVVLVHTVCCVKPLACS